MPEIHYKFKSSLSFETIFFSEPSISVKVLKDLINQKQSIKTNGFDLKFKDSHGKVYTDDEDIIDIKSKIIVSRVPKIAKTQLNTKKKEISLANNVTETLTDSNYTEKQLCGIEEKLDTETVIIVEPRNETVEQFIPEILKCSLCNNIMKDSMQIKCCKKSYCYECITGYLFDPDISGSLECPDCKSIISSKDVNLVENLQIRSMIHNFRNGILDSVSSGELNEFISMVPEDIFLTDENVHEVEISLPLTENLEHIETHITTEPIEVMEMSIPDESLFEENTNNLILNVIPDQPAPMESSVENPAPLVDTVSNIQEVIAETISVSCASDINQIEQHYQGHSYTNQIVIDTQLGNRTGIPVINTCQLSEIKNNANLKEASKVSIHDLDFDPVIYMKFLKIVGESCPEELRKILSNNNDSLHMSNEKKKSSCSNRRSKEEDYHDKHISKKSRYDIENEEAKYRKAFTPIEKQPENRYYDNNEKKTNRARSRSKEYYQKKVETYSNTRRSRDYETRDRDYYAGAGGPRFRNSDNSNYQDDRHKYRSGYESHRVKNNKYKRPMDR